MENVVKINAQTRFYLLLGNPVNHSLSPLIHNSAFQALNLNYRYLAAHVEEERIEEAVKGLRALSAAGANVTSPFKKAVIPYLDAISPESGVIRSVNTIVNREGSLSGTTTDGAGFYHSLTQSAPDYRLEQPAMIIGAGGSARAVAYTLARAGVSEMFIINRSIDKAEALADLVKKETLLHRCTVLPLIAEELHQVVSACRLFVYTLPVDSKEFTVALEKSSLPFRESLLFDLRYSPNQSGVMRYFNQSGGRAFNGLGMLLWQAVLAFELFTGHKAPVEIMHQAMEQ